MKAFGSRRTYARCRVVRAGLGRKVQVKLTVKNRKTDRQRAIEE